MTINKPRYFTPSSKLKEKRLRLRDWLEMRIDSPDYPGLEWVNREQKIFRIPWKHGARHGWREAIDARLFQEWSEHTGASPRDVKQHKANFRCALNSLRDIVQVHKMNKQKGEDAYRVYQMLPKKNVKQSKEWIKKRNSKLPADGMKYGSFSSTSSSDLLMSPCGSDHTHEFPPHTQEVLGTRTFSTSSELHQGCYSTLNYSDCYREIPQPSTTCFQSSNDCFSLQSFRSEHRPISMSSDVMENHAPATKNGYWVDAKTWEDTFSPNIAMDPTYQEMSVFTENAKMPNEETFHSTTSPATFSNSSDWDPNFFEDGDYLSSIATQQLSSSYHASFHLEQPPRGALSSAITDGPRTEDVSLPPSVLCLNSSNDVFEDPLMSSPADFYVEDKSYLEKSFSNFENISMSFPEDKNRQFFPENIREQDLLTLNSATSGQLPSASTLLPPWEK